MDYVDRTVSLVPGNIQRFVMGDAYIETEVPAREDAWGKEGVCGTCFWMYGSSGSESVRLAGGKQTWHDLLGMMNTCFAGGKEGTSQALDAIANGMADKNTC